VARPKGDAFAQQPSDKTELLAAVESLLKRPAE
jgi:hypothetical protein